MLRARRGDGFESFPAQPLLEAVTKVAGLQHVDLRVAALPAVGAAVRVSPRGLEPDAA
ncbi:hypothetical protein [Leucobacter celer]|uniref:hypothetical protein n=1 Tax=Leucobacter celer TaxID=668625 RepID=UPI0019D3EF2F|nr:hypothetical protein [Leucobacter celer]